MNPRSITRQQRDRIRGQLRHQLIDLIGDYDEILAGADAAERECLADRVFRLQENLRAALSAIDQYDLVKRAAVPR